MPILPPGALELRIIDGTWRTVLHRDALVEVWQGMQLLGTLSGALVLAALEYYLLGARVVGDIQEAMKTPPPRAASAVPPAIQERRRQARRTRPARPPKP